MVGGERCQAPALRLYDYCRHHRRYHQVAPLPEYARPALRTPASVQQAIFRGIHDVLGHSLDEASFSRMVRLFADSLHQRGPRG